MKRSFLVLGLEDLVLTHGLPTSGCVYLYMYTHLHIYFYCSEKLQQRAYAVTYITFYKGVIRQYGSGTAVNIQIELKQQLVNGLILIYEFSIRCAAFQQSVMGTGKRIFSNYYLDNSLDNPQNYLDNSKQKSLEPSTLHTNINSICTNYLSLKVKNMSENF